MVSPFTFRSPIPVNKNPVTVSFKIRKEQECYKAKNTFLMILESLMVKKFIKRRVITSSPMTATNEEWLWALNFLDILIEINKYKWVWGCDFESE